MQLIAMFNQAPQPAMAAVGEISGSYTALVNGSECVLKLWFNGEGFVCGSFQAEGETLELRGGYSNRLGSVHGFSGSAQPSSIGDGARLPCAKPPYSVSAGSHS